MLAPFYDPEKSYEENFQQGPFGAFSDGVLLNNTGKPKYNFLGYEVYSPFGIPAGPLINGNFVKSAFDKGFDIVTYKTVRSEKYPSYPWPNVLSVQIPKDLNLLKENIKLVANGNYNEPLSITNSFGVPSFDPEFWQKDIKKVLEKIRPGQVLIGAFQGTKKEGQSSDEYINDFRIVARFLKNAGIRIFEVNLSCPNEGTSNLLCYDTERSVKVIKVIKEEIGSMPLIIKITYFKNQETLRNFIKEVGNLVQGISAINTIPSEIINEKGEQALPGKGRLVSGVCGAAIKPAGLDMVMRLKKIRDELNYSYTIIGVGGVMKPEDFFEYRQMGADFVMSATGAMWNPYLARDIKKELE